MNHNQELKEYVKAHPKNNDGIRALERLTLTGEDFTFDSGWQERQITKSGALSFVKVSLGE